MNNFADFFHGVEHSKIQLAITFIDEKSSGVSRCSPGVFVYSIFRQPGGARRWNQHYGRGVGLLVGLWCWESLRRVGDAGAGVLFLDAAGAGARLRVSQCHRARNAVERWAGRRSGAWGLAGLGGARAGRPQAPRPRPRPAACAVGRRPPGPGLAQPVTRLPRRISPMAAGLAPRVQPAQGVAGSKGPLGES